MTRVAFSIKFAKTNQKFAENSDFCENYSLLFKIIHFTHYYIIIITDRPGERHGGGMPRAPGGRQRFVGGPSRNAPEEEARGYVMHHMIFPIRLP